MYLLVDPTSDIPFCFREKLLFFFLNFVPLITTLVCLLPRNNSVTVNLLVDPTLEILFGFRGNFYSFLHLYPLVVPIKDTHLLTGTRSRVFPKSVTFGKPHIGYPFLLLGETSIFVSEIYTLNYYQSFSFTQNKLCNCAPFGRPQH